MHNIATLRAFRGEVIESTDPAYNGINASDFPVLVKDSGNPNSAPVLDATKTPGPDDE